MPAEDNFTVTLDYDECDRTGASNPTPDIPHSAHTEPVGSVPVCSDSFPISAKPSTMRLAVQGQSCPALSYHVRYLQVRVAVGTA